MRLKIIWIKKYDKEINNCLNLILEACRLDPVISTYTINRIKDRTDSESLYVGDFVTYIHAPSNAKEFYYTLIKMYGEVIIEKALRVWWKKIGKAIAVINEL